MRQKIEPKMRIKLDPVGQFYAAAITREEPGTFYVSAHLKERLDTKILQEAVNDIMRRLPFLNGRLRRGFFWHYREIFAEPPQIAPASDFPAFSYFHDKGKGHMLRVLYGERHFLVETTHCLCDGRALAKITCALLARYFELLGMAFDKGEIIDCSGVMQDGEAEDAIARHAGTLKAKETMDILKRYGEEQKANQNNAVYSFGLSKPTAARVITKKIDLGKIKLVAKAHGATVSEYILAQIFAAIAGERASRGGKQPISVMLPVDCRSLLPTKTLLNFAAGKTIAMPETDDFSEMLKSLKQQFAQIDADFALGSIVGLTFVLGLTRFLPLSIKKLILAKVFRSLNIAATFSNLGVVRLPKEIEDRLEMLEFVICPPKQEPYNFSCITTGDMLTFTAIVGVEGTDIADNVMQALEKLA